MALAGFPTRAFTANDARHSAVKGVEWPTEAPPELTREKVAMLRSVLVSDQYAMPDFVRRGAREAYNDRRLADTQGQTET